MRHIAFGIAVFFLLSPAWAQATTGPAPGESSQPGSVTAVESSTPQPAPSAESTSETESTPKTEPASSPESAHGTESASDAESALSAAPATTVAPTSPAAAPNDPAHAPAPPPTSGAADDDYESATVALDDPRIGQAKKPHGKDAPFILGAFYDTALPVGNTADFTRRFSGRGLSIEARYRALSGFRFGGTASFQDFQEKRDVTFQYQNATIGGVQVRETAMSTVTANAAFVWTGDDRFLPYFKLGLGPSRLWRRVDMGISRVTSETWHFALVPELGAEIPLPRFIFLLALRYTYLAPSGGVDSQGYVNFSAGLGFE